MTNTPAAPIAADADETIDSIAATAAALGLYAVAWFVPWSQSRNKADKSPGLNWRISLRHTDAPMTKDAARVYAVTIGAAERDATLPSREIIAFDYSAGSGHCPAYKASERYFGKANSYERRVAIKWECENGFAASQVFGSMPMHARDRKSPLLPAFADVLSSLVMDSNVIDAGGFESWASEYGYDTDSRKAESSYRQCLEQALALRGALGEKKMERLRLACQNH